MARKKRIEQYEHKGKTRAKNAKEKTGSYLNDSGDAASSELEARSEEFEDRS